MSASSSPKPDRIGIDLVASDIHGRRRIDCGSRRSDFVRTAVRSAAVVNGGMELDEAVFQMFGAQCRAMIERKLAAMHERYGLSRAVRWDSDAPMQDAPRFRIFDAENRVLFSCGTLELGTFSPSTSSWKWGWANASLSAAQRERLLTLRELADHTGREVFRSETPFVTGQGSAWAIASMAAVQLGSAGLFDAKIKSTAGEELHAYLAYIDVPYLEADADVATGFSTLSD